MSDENKIVEEYEANPKHLKKKDSNTSKSKKKSNHKHKYADCLLICKNNPHKAKYCTECGKIANVKVFETKPTDGEGHYRVQLTSEEVFERYKGMKQIYVNSIWDKFVPIDNSER
jgi:hypothetical protein